jgi:EAL domain-containing protein (putative c-di-GMP-specific phosphodiesterase class I)
VDAAPHQLRPQDLRRSLARGEITAVFQPRVDCRTGAVVGFEALARWQHPRAGLLPADAFIRTAERGGLAAAVSETVLEQALALLAEPGTEGFEVCVNISSGSLSHGAVQRLTDICRDHGVDPSRVQLEVADGRGEDDVTAQLGFLTRLRVLGFRVSLDDFGVGYSSMAAAARLPVTEIKVDGSFVASAVESQEARAVMKAVTTFCSDLGLRCAAEGAGDRASLLEVVRLGYDVVQGHAVAAPMPAGELVAWLLAHRPSAWLGQLEECATGRSRG